MNSFDEAVERYHTFLREFMKGNPELSRQMFSEREDVVLCNPFQPFANGPDEVAETIQRAASHFLEGTIEFARVSTFTTAELGYILERESWTAKVDGDDGAGALRVTTIFRVEGSEWKVLHRHADPITTPQTTQSILQT